MIDSRPESKPTHISFKNFLSPMLYSFNDIFPAGWRIFQVTKLHDFLPNSFAVTVAKELVVSILHCQPKNERVLRNN